MKFLFAYLLIGSIKMLVNSVRSKRCTHFIVNIEINHKSGLSRKNYIYFVPINRLLRRAGIKTSGILLEDFADRNCAKWIEEFLYQATFIYKHRSKNAFLWGYYLMEKMLIFRPVFSQKRNIFVSILICVAEGLGIHLLCTYLDITGISSNILSTLTDSLSALWQRI